MKILIIWSIKLGSEKVWVLKSSIKFSLGIFKEFLMFYSNILRHENVEQLFIVLIETRI